MRAVLPAHGKSDHRCNGPDPIPVLIHLPVAAGTRRFVATDDLGGTYLRSAHLTVSTPGSSASTLEVENETTTDVLLTTDTTVDSGETSSYTAATPHVVDDSGTPAANLITRGDVLLVTVTLGTGAADATALLEFGPRLIRITP